MNVLMNIYLHFSAIFRIIVKNFCPDVVNIANLVTLNSPTSSSQKVTNYKNGNISDKEEVNLSDFVLGRLPNAASLDGNRYKANFVSPNVINLSKRNLTKDEISVLSKGLQFVPTPKHFNKALLREELEEFGRKLRLKWFFRNDELSLTLILLKKSPSLILVKMMLLLNFILVDWRRIFYHYIRKFLILI